MAEQANIDGSARLKVDVDMLSQALQNHGSEGDAELVLPERLRPKEKTSKPLPRLLVNLPRGFFQTPALEPRWERLRRLADIRLTSHDRAEQIAGDLRWAQAVLMWSWPALTEDVLQRAPDVRILAHLDLTQRSAQAALGRKIPVSVSRSGFSPAVAEMALALILSTYRRLSDYHAAMRAGSEQWVTSFPDSIDPSERELSERTVGIIGFGRVGSRLRELLVPFGCRVVVHDPFANPKHAFALEIELVSLPELLTNSEIVVLCAASNEGTHHLLGEAEIGLLAPGSLFVNVARAALVDTGALLARLSLGNIRAAIDVFDQEPLPKDHPFRTLPNCYMTPHRAGGTLASVGRIIDYLIDDLEAFWTGNPLKNQLTKRMVSSLDA